MTSQRIARPFSGERQFDTLGREVARAIETLPVSGIQKTSNSNSNLTVTETTWTPFENTGPIVRSVLVRVTTTDATVTPIYRYAIRPGNICTLTVTVQGRRTQTSDAFSTDFVVTYQRTGDAAPTIVGSLAAATNRNTAGASAWAATAAVNGNDVEVRVTGQSAATVQWSAEVRGQENA